MYIRQRMSMLQNQVPLEEEQEVACALSSRLNQRGMKWLNLKTIEIDLLRAYVVHAYIHIYIHIYVAGVAVKECLTWNKGAAEKSNYM